VDLGKGELYPYILRSIYQKEKHILGGLDLALTLADTGKKFWRRQAGHLLIFDMHRFEISSDRRTYLADIPEVEFILTTG